MREGEASQSLYENEGSNILQIDCERELNDNYDDLKYQVKVRQKLMYCG